MKSTKTKKNKLLYKGKHYVIVTKKKLNIKSKESRNVFDITKNFIIKIFCIISFIFLIFTSYKKRNKKKINNKLNKIIKKDYFACFVGMGKLENKYLRELIEYYSKLGVEKFILGDNNDPNSERFSDVIQDYVDKGLVDIINLIDSSFGQSAFFNLTYMQLNKSCKWFTFFDIDEYLEVHFEKNKPLGLKEFLTNQIFDKCEAIEFNWVMYTDNDLIYYDKRPLNERFTEPYFNFPDNIFVKSMVRGNLNKTVIEDTKSNHVPDKNLKICDSMGKIITDYNPYTLKPPVFDYGYLKHFSDKTAEEYCNKVSRGFPGKWKLNPQERVEMFFQINKFSYEKLKVLEKLLNRTFNVDKIFNNKYFRGNKSIN